jgi:hypothetical protein
MDNIKFDLTTKEGLINTQEKLKVLKSLNAGKTIGATISIDFEGMFRDLTNMISNFIDRIFDLFDDTKKLEKQMELAIKTIEVSRASGAKSIDITINSKSDAKLKLFVEEIDAEITGKISKDNSITYQIKF